MDPEATPPLEGLLDGTTIVFGPSPSTTPSIGIVEIGKKLWHEQNYDDAISILETLTGSRTIGQAIARGTFNVSPRHDGALLVTVPNGFQEMVRDGLFVVRPPLFGVLHDVAKQIWLGTPLQWKADRQAELEAIADQARGMLDWLSEATPSIADQVTAFAMIGDALTMIGQEPRLWKMPRPPEWLATKEEALIALNETRDALMVLAESQAIPWPESDAGAKRAIEIGKIYSWNKEPRVKVLALDMKRSIAQVQIPNPTGGAFKSYTKWVPQDELKSQ